MGQYGGDLLSAQLSLRKQYGDIVRVNKIWRKDVVLLYDPALVEEMFRKEGVWPIRDSVHSMAYYRTVTRKDRYRGVHGIITSHGKDWYHLRSKVNLPMMNPKSAQLYTGAISEVADDFVLRMRELRDERKELPADFINELNKWALEEGLPSPAMAVVALDTRLGCLSPNLTPDSEPQRMINALHVVEEGFYKLDARPSLWRFISTPTWRRLVRAFDYAYEISEKYVNEALSKSREKTDREPSILHRLMAIDPEVAKIMASDMLFVGVDTTANTSAAVLLYLAKNPLAQQKAREEVLKVLPDAQSPVTSDTLKELHYLKACLKETLRIFPISFGTIRETQDNVVLGDYQIPKGVDVIMGNMVMSRDEKHYPRTMSFEPERWLRGDPSAHTANPFVTLPFGFGPRSCIGRRLGEIGVLTLLSKTLRNFWLEFHHSDEIEFSSRIINTITTPLKFRLIE